MNPSFAVMPAILHSFLSLYLIKIVGIFKFYHFSDQYTVDRKVGALFCTLTVCAVS